MCYTEIMKWDYEHSLLQVSGSLHAYFGMDRGHGSDPDIDAWLQKYRPQHLIAILIDAMGVSILEKHLPEDSFLRRHLSREVSTVFPPTTAAATTAFMCGLSPKETGWLGWNQYFREKDDEIILFLNEGQYSHRTYEPGFSRRALPAERIHEALQRKGIRADSVWPGWGDDNPCDTFDDLLEKTIRLAPENRFLYVYWDLLDTLMHRYGTEADIIRDTLREYDRKIEAFSKKLPESTAVLITADHSQIDVRCHDLSRDADLCAMLEHRPALEPRTVVFSVRQESMKQFRKLFEERFGNDFVLLDSDEAVSLFGPGEAHARTREFLGDYVAVAVSDLELDYMPAHANAGNHAGFVKEERMVPLILFQQV